MIIETRKPEDCKYDIVSLGEIMLRLDPGDSRIHTTREFRVWEGGGEYNVARGMRRCFGKRAGVVTAFADNPVGRLVEDFILQGGVDTSLIKWMIELCGKGIWCPWSSQLCGPWKYSCFPAEKRRY